jgi:hypothetical protein
MTEYSREARMPSVIIGTKTITTLKYNQKTRIMRALYDDKKETTHHDIDPQTYRDTAGILLAAATVSDFLRRDT